MEELKEILRPLAEKSELGYEAAPMTEQEYAQEKANMYNNSPGDLNAMDGYDCDLCKNKGYIAVVRQNEMFGYYSEMLTPCKCRKIRAAIRELQKSGLKNVVKDYTFAKYETPEEWQARIKQTAERFCADEQGKWFFIGGQSGAGKSHICSAITLHYIRQGIPAKYMKWRDEIVRIKALVNDPQQYAEIMKTLKETPVLYIDDLFKVGKGADGQTAQPTIADINAAFEIINHRYNAPDLVTIISSERTLTELLTIDEATAGRIAERAKGGGYCINLKQDSKRNWRLRGLIEI